MYSINIEYRQEIIKSCNAMRNKAALWATGELVVGAAMTLEGFRLPGAALLISGAWLGKLALNEHEYAQNAHTSIAPEYERQSGEIHHD